MSNFYYITIATKPHIILDKLQNKAAENNEYITVLGAQENRNIGWNAKGNFGIKLREVKDFVFNPEISNEDIILFTDAYDVIYCGDKKRILDKFYKFSHPLIFGAETDCHPDPKQAANYTKIDEEFSFLNSGLFIGYAWAIRQCLQNYHYNDQDDDQLYWTKQLFQYKNIIQLDYKNEIFLNTYNIDHGLFHYDGNQVYYKDRTPIFIHVNGPNKSELSSYIHF
tara:strand:- start:49 stop:720 length:672 start_codon:yes stop_codon:yes gene_type:complete